ncbi:hypothetical protein AB0912_20365 [Streptomyces sp. NPDC007084]|uniref:hypothetical protein n=1 Tax=Streptomyces sp. NPDC007084 TaxID=3154313 RepID=UPI00345216CF
MLIDFRPSGRLRGKNPVDFDSAVGPVLNALAAGRRDVSRMRVACDWVQYRENFRDIVDVRPVLPRPDSAESQAGQAAGAPGYDVELAVDVRRSGTVALGDLTAARLAGDDLDGRVYLEDWGLAGQSCIWDFNALYWSALELWEKASGRGYEQALPGGESDARNRGAARELISGLFTVWDRLAAAGALPEELYVAELGVGNGSQAKIFLDEFRDLDQTGERGYYRRLHYLMCDYSQYVLDLARETVVAHAGHVSSVALDATRPSHSLGFLRGKTFLLYISNVYDNLPTDEVAQLGGRPYSVQTRAYFPPGAATELAASVSAEPEELPGLVRRLLRLGPALLADSAPEHIGDTDTAVRFWQEAWSALRLEERYVPLAGLDLYSLAPGVSGEELRPLLESGADVRMHVSSGAVASFVDSLPLLHPFGRLVCHDLFVTKVQDYRVGFRGPGKYDGSVVNWVNGPLLAHAGRRRGFDVRFEPFRHRSGGNIMTMTTQPGD